MDKLKLKKAGIAVAVLVIPFAIPIALAVVYYRRRSHFGRAL